MDNLKPHSEQISYIPDILRGLGHILFSVPDGNELDHDAFMAVDSFLHYLANDMEMQLYFKEKEEMKQHDRKQEPADRF